MSRKTRDKIVKNRVKYYTANHFAENAYVAPTTARRFLAHYESLKGSKSPKLYSVDVMRQAISDYLSKRPAKYTQEKIAELHEKQRAEKEKELAQRRAEAQEQELIEDSNENSRANDEGQHDEDSTLEYLNSNFQPVDKRLNAELKETEEIEKEVDQKITEIFPKIALQHLLAVNGFAFDFEQFKNDVYTDVYGEYFRELGQPRSKTQRAAIKRLHKNDAYLIKTARRS